ncbi:MAG TPA: nuclear transport factor 2 family protein, partial [Anaeromyxobacteraceae bacterium]|nr:nuclear transport factor 2 family protein [Anaeromyxobacteraceae bacterium]
LVPAALAAAAGLAAWLAWPHLASLGGSLESPETQLRRALAAQTRAQLDDVYGFRSGGTVELSPVKFDDVAPDVRGDRATVVAMLSAEGRAAWRDQAAALSYLGRERFHMRRCAIALWCGEGDQFDRLRGVLTTLFRRHDAWQTRDAEAYGRLLAPGYRDGGEDRAAALARVTGALGPAAPRARVLGWQVRIERDAAEVGEDLELAGPADALRRERHVYRLAREGERWLFVSGL